MMNKIIIYILIVSACFNGKLTSAQDFASMAQINFTSNEMKVMPTQTYINEGIHSPFVIASLNAYHLTQYYVQSLDEFREYPQKYFDERLSALESLLLSIEEINFDDPILNKLWQTAYNKKLYIQALPSMQEPHSTKADAINPLLTSRKLSVNDHFWAEVIDPLHRLDYGIYRMRWKVSNIPNYFIYLDTVENDELLNAFAPLNLQVNYFYHAEERQKHRIKFKDNLVYTADGKLFDTSEYEAAHSGKGFSIFVIGEDGDFYINHHLYEHIHHSSEFAGGDVIGAGEISAEKGKIVAISNKSGHYLPKSEDMLETLHFLKEKIGSLENITAHLWLITEDHHYTADYRAEEFLKTNGYCLPLPTSPTPPLHTAILQDIPEFAEEALFSSNIDEIIKGHTALHLAASIKKPFWIDFLLKNNASTLILDNNKRSPLEIAASKGDLKSIELLYSYTIDEEIRKKAFYEASKSGDSEIFHFFLKQNFSLTDIDNLENTLFHYAAMAPNANIMRYILNTPYANLMSTKNLSNQTPLHLAAIHGCLDTVNVLLDLGLNLDSKDNDGNTVLHLAAQGGKSEIIELLLEIAPNELFLAKNYQGTLPLHYAAKHLSTNLLKKFLDKTGDLEVQDNQGESLLFYTLRGRNYENYCALIERGANFKLMNNEGYSLVHVAATIDKIFTILSLTYDNQINVAALDGNTPLHLSLISKNIYTAHFLLNFATLELIHSLNNSNQTILELAQDLNDQGILNRINSFLNK